MRNPTNWLARTGQLWKYWALLPLSLAAIAPLIVEFWIADNPEKIFLQHRASEWEPWVLVCFVVGGVLLFAWLTLSIRCPNCKRYPVLHVLRTTSANKWSGYLLSMSECPLCHSNGQSEQQVV